MFFYEFFIVGYIIFFVLNDILFIKVCKKEIVSRLYCVFFGIIVEINMIKNCRYRFIFNWFLFRIKLYVGKGCSRIEFILVYFDGKI